MRGRWDAKNNPRDYGIEKPYWEPLYVQHHAALLFRRVGPKIFLKFSKLQKITSFFSLAMQREQYLREKKEGSEAYRKALDTQVR